MGRKKRTNVDGNPSGTALSRCSLSLYQLSLRGAGGHLFPYVIDPQKNNVAVASAHHLSGFTRKVTPQHGPVLDK